MGNVLHAKYFADQALQRTVPIVEHTRLAEDTYRIRFAEPDMAARIVPGQFLMLRLDGFDDPLIGRPLALYDTVDDPRGEPWAIDVVYVVKGKFTRRLQHLQPGQTLSVWGPLGNGFSPRPAERLLMVAGGIGQTPFLALGRETLRGRSYGVGRNVEGETQVSLLYGARSQRYLAGLDAFRAAGIDLQIATEDGTAGHHGLVTELLADALNAAAAGTRVVCCGPEPMMKAVAEMTRGHGVSCEVSLETPMACGIGICFTCVARVRDDSGEWDYKRTCVEGPVFDAGCIAW